MKHITNNNFSKSLILILMFISSCSHVEKKETFSILPLNRDIQTFIPQINVQPDNLLKGTINKNSRLTLNTIMEMVLFYNLKLRSKSWVIRREESLVKQASLLKNPEVEFTITDSKQGETEFSISQEVELSGKRSTRETIAKNKLEQKKIEYELTRLSLIKTTKTIFYKTYSLQKKIELLSEAINTAKKVIHSAKSRVKRGAAHRVEITRSELSLVALNIRLDKIKREFISKQHALAKLWGEEEIAPFVISESLPIPRDIPKLSMLKSIIGQNPKLTKLKIIRRGQQSLIQHEKAMSIPNITIGASYLNNKNDNSKSGSFSISFPIPLFDRNQGNIAAAVISKTESILNYKSGYQQTIIKLHSYYNKLKNNFDEIMLNKDVVLPKSAEAFNDIKKLYRNGRESYLSLSESQQNFIDIKINQINALTNFYIQKANIESLLGESLENINIKQGTINETK